MKTYYIYTLTDSYHKTITYVGMTTKPNDRLEQHHWPTKSKQLNGRDISKLSDWVQHMVFNNVEYTMEIVEEITTDNYLQVRRLEAYWIQQFKQWGFPLINQQSIQ